MGEDPFFSMIDSFVDKVFAIKHKLKVELYDYSPNFVLYEIFIGYMLIWGIYL